MRSALVLASLFAILASAGVRADQPSLPNSILTPGTVDPAATREVVCNGTARSRRHVTMADKAQVLAAYNIPDIESPFYEMDHLVPLAIGGANAVSNLWPQPWAEAVQKDALEVELQRRVCMGLVSQAAAQREIADDWTAAYERYVGGGRLVVAPEPGPMATALPTTPATQVTLRARLMAGALRLAKRWILGLD